MITELKIVKQNDAQVNFYGFQWKIKGFTKDLTCVSASLILQIKNNPFQDFALIRFAIMDGDREMLLVLMRFTLV